MVKNSLLLVILFLFVNKHTIAQTEQRFRFTSITPSENTGQDYSPWFSDDTNILVQDAWQYNFKYVDVSLKLAQHCKITRLSLYDYQGVFTDNPAYIYAVNGNKKTLIATFTGPNYKVFEDVVLPQALDADSLVIHKYCNNIPQKIFVFGYLPIDSTKIVIPLPDTSTLVKIPIDVKRWYQVDNASNGLDGLFDGITNIEVTTGWGKILDNYDAYYPVAPGEKINLYKIKFYSYQGGTGPVPVTLSVINSKGQRTVAGTFFGDQYDSWVGPYPERNTSGLANFNLDTAFKDIKFLVLNCGNKFPTEIELYGTYTPPTPPTPIVKKPVKLKQFFGINTFEWDFEDPANTNIIDNTKIKAIKSFTQIRHYLDWDKLESQKGNYTYNPTQSGGWNYDAMYAWCKTQGIDVLADIKTQPIWMQNTYPDSVKNNENVPVNYGADFANPASYIDQGHLAFQFAARYGSNANIDTTLLNVYRIPRWTNDNVNTIKTGLGLIKYIECDNERDKWWKGRSAYQTCFEYAANLSAFYDGNKNTMGPGVGIKNADPNMMVVMGGLALATPDYVRGMIDWCIQHRGYKADGTVNFCWDVINYHYYSNDAQSSQSGNSTRGSAPEVVGTATTAKSFIDMAHLYANDMPVWVTELGYDINQGSPLKAIPIGKKTALQTQADWILRSSLLYARTGVERIFLYQMYDDNPLNPVQFGSSGLINSNKTRKPAADYLYQTNQLLGEYMYKSTVNTDPIVDRYELNGKPAFVLVVPDEKGRTATYTLDLQGADSAKIYKPQIGKLVMSMQAVKTINGKLTLTVTETPVFVIPVNKVAVAALQSFSTSPTVTNFVNQAIQTDSVSKLESLNTVHVYPNPTSGNINVSFENTNTSDVSIRVSDATNGRIYKNYKLNKSNQLFSEKIDIQSLPMGPCIIEIKQGPYITIKKIMKIN